MIGFFDPITRLSPVRLLFPPLIFLLNSPERGILPWSGYCYHAEKLLRVAFPAQNLVLQNYDARQRLPTPEQTWPNASEPAYMACSACLFKPCEMQHTTEDAAV